MKTFNHIPGLSFLFLLLFVSACYKNDGPAYLDLLTKAPWIMRSDQFINASGQYSEEIQDCQRDDTWTFKTDDTYDFMDNADKCDPLHSLDYSSGWALVEKEAVLVFKFVFDEYRYRIITINETTLVLHKINIYNPNKPTVQKITFNR